MTAIVVDNEKARPRHRNGYNGLANLSLRTSGCKVFKGKNIFVSSYAGLNLEHYFDEKNRGKEELFQPRRVPMVIARWKSANSAILSQDPFPPWNISYVSTFVASHHGRIDFSMEITPRGKEIERSSFLGVFWASYINHPVQLGMNIMGHVRGEKPADKRWIYVETTKHGEKSAIMPAMATYIPSFSHELPKHWLFASKGDYVHDIPLFCGVSGNVALALMFKDKERVWFAHSPSGGGPGCPAWDFFAIFPSPRVDETCKVDGRLVAKPFTSLGAISEEYDAFVNGT